MDIRVGAVEPIGATPDKLATPVDVLEGRVLAVRPPRARSQGPPRGRTELRRPDSPRQDPPEARVLVLMVRDGTSIPKDIQNRPYRVVLRFVRR
jgi:hypothetical protein